MGIAENKKAVLNRLKRIEGQVRGIQNMIESDRYCIDVLIQINSIDAALKQVGFTLMEDHTKNCVQDAIKKGEGNDAIEELMTVIKQYSK